MKTQPSKTSLSLLAPAALLLALLSPSPCAAQSSLDFTLAAPTVTAGASPTDQVFTFSGTLTNTTSAPLYLNGDQFSVDAPLGGDDAAFADTFLSPTAPNGIPLPQPTLGAGRSLSLALFNVTVPTGTPLGSYFGLFEIQGGAMADDYGLLGSRPFTVTTTSNPVPSVPEVPGGSALAVGLLMTTALVVTGRRKKDMLRSTGRTS